MLKKILLISATVMAAVALLAVPASAQYPTLVFNATISDTTLVVGQSVQIEGECSLDGVACDDEVDFAINPPLGSFPINADGSFSGSVTIPDIAPGDYTITATAAGETISVDVTVLASSGGGGTGGTGSGSGSGTGALARTGTEVDGLVKLGGGLLIAGAAAVLFATKRRSATV